MPASENPISFRVLSMEDRIPDAVEVKTISSMIYQQRN